MFASMFKTIFKKSIKKDKMEKKDSEAIDIARQQVNQLLIEMDDVIDENMSSCDNQLTFNDSITDGFELLSVSDNFEGYSEDLVNGSDDDKSVVSSVGEKKRAEDDDPSKTKLINQINSLQCLFTWNIKPKHKKNVILSIQNNYGEYNLDISSPEFTFERFIGNLVISYEIFLKGDSEIAQMKILEIGKWLEELDSGTDEFYLSINIGLKHVMTSTFIHMLFATNLTEECKWLLKDISSFANLDPKSRASVYAIRAAVLTEYGDNLIYLKKACECGKKACELDPNTPHWFYIYSLALSAQRRFKYTYKSCPTEFEINAIQQAILLSDGKNTYYNYQRMTLDKETVVDKFHKSTNKHDKSVIDKNHQENKIIVQMIKTIMSMEPKDPHLVVKCARTLITLPRMVRDFKLGKQYLQSAIKMAPNDSTVLTAVTNAINVYNEIIKKNEQKTKTIHNKSSFKNKPLTFREELRIAVNKHKNGENPIPYLVDLTTKYTGHNNKWTIMAQICSYTILFLNNLRFGVEQFIMLIEQQPGIISNSLITHHYSSFGSKTFNLAEFLCNEIRLATNSSKTPSEDMLFYYKMLTQIMETFNLNIKDVDPSMKDKLIVGSCARPAYSNRSANENNYSGDESVHSEVKQKIKNKNHKPQHLQNTGPKIHIRKSESNRPESKGNENFKNSNASKNIQNKIHQANTSSDFDQLKFKMSKFLNSSANSSASSNAANHLSLENLRNLKTQAEIEQYTKQLYQSILTNTQQQYNLQGNNSQNLNQNHANLNPLFQQFQNQKPPSLLNLEFQTNQEPPPLLSLKPQINQQKPRPATKQLPKKPFPKKM